MTTPFEGLGNFAKVWNRIARELLQKKPWDTWDAAPQGPHGAIDDLELGALFVHVGLHISEAESRTYSRDELWPAWAASKLDVHGKTLADLDKGQADNVKKRTKKQIDTGIQHLAFFDLIEIGDGHVYRLTKEGMERLSQLVQPASQPSQPASRSNGELLWQDTSLSASL